MGVLIGLLLAGEALAAQPTMRPSDEQRGEELYRRHCVACHGVRNGGQGPATTSLVHPVPALQGQVKAGEEHVRVVLKGQGAMPGFEASFGRPDAVRVLKYMKSLGPTKALPDKPGGGADKKKPVRPTPGKPLQAQPATVKPAPTPEEEAEEAR